MAMIPLGNKFIIGLQNSQKQIIEKICLKIGKLGVGFYLSKKTVFFVRNANLKNFLESCQDHDITNYRVKFRVCISSDIGGAKASD